MALKETYDNVTLSFPDHIRMIFYKEILPLIQKMKKQRNMTWIQFKPSISFN